MDKSVLLVTCRIRNGREYVQPRIFIEYAIGTERFAIHDMAADHAVDRRKLDVGIVVEVDIVVRKKHYETVYKKSKEDDNRKDGRLPQISKWR